EKVATEVGLQVAGQRVVDGLLHARDVAVVLLAVGGVGGRAGRRGWVSSAAILDERATGHEFGAAEIVDLDAQVVFDDRTGNGVEERVPAVDALPRVAQLAVGPDELAGAELVVEALDRVRGDVDRE